jgi:hypothetical protein
MSVFVKLAKLLKAFCGLLLLRLKPLNRLVVFIAGLISNGLTPTGCAVAKVETNGPTVAGIAEVYVVGACAYAACFIPVGTGDIRIEDRTDVGAEGNPALDELPDE